jgi:hypothetical protein
MTTWTPKDNDVNKWFDGELGLRAETGEFILTTDTGEDIEVTGQTLKPPWLPVTPPSTLWLPTEGTVLISEDGKILTDDSGNIILMGEEEQ